MASRKGPIRNWGREVFLPDPGFKMARRRWINSEISPHAFLAMWIPTKNNRRLGFNQAAGKERNIKKTQHLPHRHRLHQFRLHQWKRVPRECQHHHQLNKWMNEQTGCILLNYDHKNKITVFNPANKSHSTATPIPQNLLRPETNLQGGKTIKRELIFEATIFSKQNHFERVKPRVNSIRAM